MTVPFYDLAVVNRRAESAIRAAISAVWDRGWYVLGPSVSSFEQAFALFNERRRSVGVASGLDAIEVGLRAFGIGPGDEVVVPSHTFFATWLGVLRAGARIRVVDVDPATWLMDVDRLEGCITAATKAIMPVHLYGASCDMTRILSLAEDRGLRVISDAAQAHGTLHGDRPVAALGDAACFSFYPSKTLGALGDGGAVVLDDEHADAEARQFRNYGSAEKYVYAVAGINSRLDELQAAVLEAKLELLQQDLADRRLIRRSFLERLGDLEDLTFQKVQPETDPAWHLVVVRTSRRDALRAWLDERGIQTIIHYPVACHAQQAARHLDVDPAEVRVASVLADEVLSLPMWPGMHEDTVDRVADAVRAFFKP